MKLFSKSILFLILFVFPINWIDPVYSAPKEYNPGSKNLYSSENILGFTRHLVAQKEYYRAIVELKRLDSYYPGFISKDIYYTTELFLLFQGRQYQQILTKKPQEYSPDTYAINSIYTFDSLLENSEFLNAKTLAEATGIVGYKNDINLYLYKRMILSYLVLNMTYDVKSLLQNHKLYIYNDLNDFRFDELIRYSTDNYISLKNPYKAMFLGIIPGLGYVYSGKKATGAIAFILISTLSALTYYSFRTDNKPIGVFVGAAATFFYGGSILGGYLSATKYNDSISTEMKNYLSDKLQLENDRYQIYNTYGVGSAGK